MTAEREGVAELEQHIEVLRELRDDYHLCGPTEYSEALDAAIRALRQGGEPVAWTLRFHAPSPSAALIERFPQVLVDGFGEVNPMTTFRTKEEADAYADRSATPPHALPRPLVAPLYAAPPSPAKEG